MALVFGRETDAEFTQDIVLAWQRFLTVSPWEAQAVQREIQAVFNEEFVPSTREWNLGTVGVIDGSGFVKRGDQSVGVQRQWCGRVGKKENCQVGVFLVGVTPERTALVDHQLYLPKDWAADAQRRKKTRVPADITFQTKPEIAATLLVRSTVSFDWLVADEEFGRDGALLDALEERHQRYLVEVPCNTTAWISKPARQTPDEFVQSVQEIAAALSSTEWHTIKLRDGAKGPLAFEFARVRIWSVRHRHVGPPLWLLIRRTLERTPEVKYYLSNAAYDTPLRTMAEATGVRWRVEEFFEDGKSQLGMAEYEARSWTSWHHHMSLVALAHLFVTQTRRDLKRKNPALTLDMALRLIRAAMPRPHLSLEEAEKLVEYHQDRNDRATKSHCKTWLAKHLGFDPRK
jgi:SRSO17 transposase